VTIPPVGRHMPDKTSDNSHFSRRTLIVIVILALTVLLIFFGPQRTIDVQILKPLNSFQRNIGKWEYAGEVKLQDKVVGMLGVDDYIEYIYESPDNQRIDLYVSYFESLREGKQFHSPKNCIVGSGSEVVSTGVVDLPIDGERGRKIPVNIMVMKNRGERQIVLYWFQCRGRYIRSEYAEKVCRVIDSMVSRRTDGAFIRIIASEREDKDTSAELIDFTSRLVPVLEQYIPGRQLLSADGNI